jgi:hypothetical protein
LLVDGFRRTGTELMDAYRYFFDAKGNQVGSRPAGTMEWDNREGHKHWHFPDFAQYKREVAAGEHRPVHLVRRGHRDRGAPGARHRHPYQRTLTVPPVSGIPG